MAVEKLLLVELLPPLTPRGRRLPAAEPYSDRLPALIASLSRLLAREKSERASKNSSLSPLERLALLRLCWPGAPGRVEAGGGVPSAKGEPAGFFRGVGLSWKGRRV